MTPILLTGGLGYIGSHTAIVLYENGYLPIIIDNLSNSDKRIKYQLDNILNIKLPIIYADICCKKSLDQLYELYKPEGVIHFAAYKSVAKSVTNPLSYYSNNLIGLLSLLEFIDKYTIPHLIFSSSATVYGSVTKSPVTENSPILPAVSPYGSSKQVCERIILDSFSNKSLQQLAKGAAILLRYFNPAGAHPSGEIGELPLGQPQNLVPAITQSHIGKIPALQIFGKDYPTRDGSCIRDFIHVMDIANAHVLALNFLRETKIQGVEIFNVGTGNGTSVLEVIKAFETVNKLKLNYQIAPRRDGDVMEIYSNKDKIEKILGWEAKFSLEEIMSSAWIWEQNLAKGILENIP